MNLASKLFKGDRVIWVIFMALCVVSVIEVYSATSTLAYKSATHWDPIVRHVSFILGGFVLVLLLHHIPCKFYALLTVFLPVSAVLLAITPYFGVVVNGEPRWLEILGIRFQPSEIAKLAVIGYTAFILSKQNMFTEKQMFKYILIGAGIICALIFTNNGSTALLLFSVVLMMMFLGQISFIRLLKFVGILVAAASLMVALLYVMPDGVMDYLPDRAHTWKGRIERFNDPTPSVTFEPGRAVNIDDDDYQVVHAKIAIARGGVLGQFPGYGQQRDFLPQAYSDFIYAIIIEEMGLLGSKAHVKLHEEELNKYVYCLNIDMIGVTLGKEIAVSTAENTLVDYISYVANEVGVPLKSSQGVYSSDSTPFADKGIPATSFARISPMGGAKIHSRKDVISPLKAEAFDSSLKVMVAFAERILNSVIFPIPRSIPDNMKTEIDYYFGRKERN